MQKVSCLPINTKIIPNTLKPSYEKNAMPKLESTRLTEKRATEIKVSRVLRKGFKTLRRL